MKQSITGYHTDEEGHWVAQLFCGHNQHVRHDPPWMVREWVTTASGRQNMLGHRLDCVKCDEDAPPDERPALVVSIQVGLPQTIGSEHSWTSSFIKQQVTEPIWLAAMNLAGDQQADLAHHGGPDKAVCVYPAIHYWHWRSQLKFPEMQWGAFGENFTVSELTEQDVCIGDVWSVGDALVQISQPRQPCWKLARRWSIKDLALQVQQTGFTGWYFRVLKEGLVQRDAVLQLVERSHEQWTIAAANQLMHHDKHDRMGVSRLASIPELSHSWRSTLTKRAETGQQPGSNRTNQSVWDSTKSNLGSDDGRLSDCGTGVKNEKATAFDCFSDDDQHFPGPRFCGGGTSGSSPSRHVRCGRDSSGRIADGLRSGEAS